MDQPLRMLLRDKHARTDVLYTVRPEDAVEDAVRTMVEGHVGCVVVMEGERLTGIFTERDLMRRVVYEGRDVRATAVKEVMTSEVATVSPEMTVKEAMMFCQSKRVRHIPVVEDTTLLGVLSLGDLNNWLIRDQEAQIHDLIKYIYDERA